MATTTISVAAGDTPQTATVAAGGSAGTKMVQVIVDWSKVPSHEALLQALEISQQVILRQGRGIAQA